MSLGGLRLCMQACSLSERSELAAIEEGISSECAYRFSRQNALHVNLSDRSSLCVQAQSLSEVSELVTNVVRSSLERTRALVLLRTGMGVKSVQVRTKCSDR